MDKDRYKKIIFGDKSKEEVVKERELKAEKPYVSATGRELGYFDPLYLNPRYNKYSKVIKGDTLNPEMVADEMQNFGGALVNALKGFGINSAAGFLDAFGSNDPRGLANMAFGNTEKAYGNWFNRAAQDLREKGQEVAPIFSGSDSMATDTYWLNQFSNLGTTFGIIGEAVGEGALITAATGGFGGAAAAARTSAKIAQALHRVKVLNTAGKVKSAGNYLFGMWQGVKEAHMNGLENYNNVYQEYINNNRSPIEAEKAAAEAATKSFRMEVGPQVLLNGLQWMAIGGKFNAFQRGGGAQPGISNFTETAFSKLVPKTASRGVKKAADWAGNILSEGVEEGVQSTVQSVAQYQVDKERDYNDGKTLSEYVFTNDLRDSVVGGLLGGGMFKLIGNAKNRWTNSSISKQNEKLMADFIGTTAERAKVNLRKLADAESKGDLARAAKIKEEMGYNNIEAALLHDYIKNDGEFTTFNSQLEQLKEISDIIKSNDIEGLEKIGLVNETDENGVNVYQDLKNNIDTMISDAIQQKEDMTSNLEFQMHNTGEENYQIAERMTRLQYMKRKNESAIANEEDNLEKLKTIHSGAFSEEQAEYVNLQAKLFAFNNSKIDFEPTLLREKEEAEKRIKELEESYSGLSFNERENTAKSFINAHTRILETKNANVDIDKDLRELSNVEGILEFKKERLRKGVESYKETNDIGQLENIKTNISTNQDVKELFSKEEIDNIKKDIDSKISKLKSIENTTNKSTKTVEVPSERRVNERRTDISRSGDSAIEAARRRKAQAAKRTPIENPRVDPELSKKADKALENVEENKKKGGVVKNASKAFSEIPIVDDSEKLFAEDGHNPINGIEDAGVEDMAPREFNPKREKARSEMKNLAKSYLVGSRKNTSLEDYMTALMNSEGITIDMFDTAFYYAADGYYEAKGENFEDNIEHVKEVYNKLLGPVNVLKAFESAISDIEQEIENTTVEKQEKEIEASHEEINKRLEEDKQPVSIDEHGRAVNYIGNKIAAPAIKVPYAGVPYRVETRIVNGKSEVTFLRDEVAESEELAAGSNTPEGIKRAFMMNPKLAKKGVPVKVYIPTLNELMDDVNGFVVTDWKRDENGVLVSSTIPFSQWMNKKETVTTINDAGKPVTVEVDKSVGSQRFLEKVPVFMVADINGQRFQMGSAIHEIDWWNERNVANFERDPEVIEAKKSGDENAVEVAMNIARTKQEAVINAARQETLAVRRQIWENTNREDWNNGVNTLIGMEIIDITDGVTLRIPPDKPKKSIREANNDLRLGIVLSDSKGDMEIAISSKDGKYNTLPQNRIYNPSILKVARKGFAVTAIPYKEVDNKMMYLIQLVDTGYSGAQDKLKFLFDEKQKISKLAENYIEAFRLNKDSKETKNFGTRLKTIFDLAGINSDSFFNNPTLEFVRKNLLRYYPELKNGHYKTTFEKDNISGDRANIVVFDQSNNPTVYKPNEESTENSYVQMLKETIYTDHEYIEIRDLTKEDPTATIKVADVQPRIHLAFDKTNIEKQVRDNIKKAEEEQKREEAERKEEEKQDVTSEESTEDTQEFSLTEGQKYTVINHLFHKMLGKFKTESVSSQDIAIALRRILEDSISDIKDTHPQIYNYLIEHKDEIVGLGDYEDAAFTLREAILDHFNIGTLSEVDDSDIDVDASLEKNHSKLSQEYNVKTSISSKLKRVFSGIPVNSKRRRGEEIAGLTEYMELDDVFSALQDLLADAPNNFNVLKARVKEKMALNPDEFGFLENISSILESLDYQLQAEVLFKLNQTKNRMYFVYSKEKNGQYVLQVLDANSREPLINAKMAAMEQVKMSPLVENIGNGDYTINKAYAENVSKRIKVVLDNFKNPDFTETANILSDFGIYVDGSTLEALYKIKPDKYINVVSNILRQFNINITAFKNSEKLNFDNKKQNILLNNNNNYLNNLLGEIIKITFNIDQSMSIAGKTINAFSQPNFFSEQVRKILSLKGEDLKETSNHLVKKLLENGYSKNSMLIKLISDVDEFGELSKNSKELLEEISIGYTSLNVIKRKNLKSDDQGLSELSPPDYDTALIGFFGDMGKTLSATLEGIPLRMAKMTTPTLSDSSQMILMNTPVLNLNNTNFRVSNGRIVRYNDSVARVLYTQLVLPELTRILEVKGTERDTLKNQIFYTIPTINTIVNEKGQNLLNFIRGNDGTVEEMIKRVESNFGKQINDAILKVITSEVEQKIKVNDDNSISGTWVDNGFVAREDNRIVSNILDTEFLNSKFQEGSTLGKVEIAAWDFVINYFITQAQMQMLFAGDVANYSKAKPDQFYNGDIATPNTENNTLEEKNFVYANIARATSENLSKRLKAMISPGNRIAFSENKQYVQLMIEDSTRVSSVYKQYLKSWYRNISEEDLDRVDKLLDYSERIREFEGRAVPKENTTEYNNYIVDSKVIDSLEYEVKEIKKYLKSKYPAISGYLENTATDAQEYTTWREHLDVAFNMGKITEEEYKRIGKKLTEQSKGNFEGTRLSKEEKLIFQPMKPLHAGMYFREIDNGKTYQEFVYVKTSSFPLLPEMTKGLKLDNLRKNMERLEATTNKPVRASYQTGNKVGAVDNPMNINQLLDNDNLEITTSYSILDRDNFSIQQEKPFKTDKHIEEGERDEVGRGTQIEKILLSNGINKIQRKIFPNKFGKELLKELDIEVVDGKISGEDLYKIFTDLAVKEQNIKKDILLKSLDIDPNDFQIGSVSSMRRLQAALSKRLTNKQDKEILELKYLVKTEKGTGKYYTEKEIDELNLTPVSAEFTFPIWLSPNSRKFESVLNSIVTNEFIKLKFPGNSFPVASEEGFVPNKTLDELSKDVRKGIVFTDSYNGEGLLPERVIDGVTYPAQVLIASKFRRKVKNPITGKVVEELIDFNTPEYINPETGRIDSKKVPREVLQLFSFRIPTSAHQSGSLVEIVGFLPHSQGDLMVVPKEHTTKIGEDYDIDTRYTYSGNYIVAEDGTIKLLEKEDIPYYPKEEIDRLYKEYRDYKTALTQYINEKKPNTPKEENRLNTEIASTQFLINVLKRKKNPLTEDTEEITALEEELKTLISRLNSTRGIEELQDELNTLHDNFMQSKKLEIEKYLEARRFIGQELSYIENELINLYKSVYLSSDNEIQKLINTTINTDMAENTTKLMEAAINSSRSNEDFSIFGYEHQKSIMRLGASGKLGIGVHSNWVVWNSLIQQSPQDIRLTRAVPTEEGTVTQDERIRIGYFVSDGKLGNINALRPNTEYIPEGLKAKYENFEPRKISEINMENQNSATDNQKLQIMGKRNENKYTINVFALMNNLGFDKDIININGKDVEVLLSSLYINQPILRRYVELREKYDSIFTEYTKDVEDRISEELKNEFATNLDFVENPLTGEPTNFISNSDMEKAASEMTAQNLFDSLVTPTSELMQWGVYQQFIKLQEHATNVNKVIQLMNIDKGLGISYFNILAKKDMLNSEMRSEELNISNVESLFGDAPDLPLYNNGSEESIEREKELLEQGYIKIGEDKYTGEVFIRKPNSPNSAKLLNSISMGYYLWGNIFPYENKYFAQQVNDILGNRQDRYDNRTMDMRYDILVAIREYMYSSNKFDIYGDIVDINEERRRLLMDEEGKESLAGYLVRLKRESTTNPELAKLFGKTFFRNLEFVINKKEPSIIKYVINNTNSFNKNLPHNELEMMANSQAPLPPFAGDENYTYEKLVRDLTRYSLLNSVENGAIGFRNFIPMSVFKKYDFDTKLTALANMQVGGGRFFNILYNGTLKAVTSFINNDVVETDDSGTYIRIPGNILLSGIQMDSLRRIVNNINNTISIDTQAVEIKNDKIYINRPIQDVNKSRFVRQFYQHNPEYAYKVDYTQAGLKNRKAVNNTNIVDVTFEDSLMEDFEPPQFISIRGGNKENFLFELQEINSLEAGSAYTYKKINKLGGFGVNEYNPNGEVNTSLFEENNIKEPTVTTVQRRSFTNTRKSPLNIPKEGLTILEMQELFNNNASLPNNPEVRKLKNIVESLKDFIDPSTKVYAENLDKGPGVYNRTDNIIKLDPSQYSPGTMSRYYRVFVEEVVHSLTSRELELYLVSKDTHVEVVEGNVNVILSERTNNTPAPVLKLVQLYKNSIEALIKEEISSSKEPLTWKKAYENILKRDTTKDTTGYRIQNLHEFVAGIFTDSTFREKMATIPYKSSGRSVLQHFADFVKKMLENISKRVDSNISEETLNTVVEFISTIPPKISPKKNTINSQQMLETDKKAETLLNEENIKDIEKNTSEDVAYSFAPNEISISDKMFNPDMAPDGYSRIIYLDGKYIGEFALLDKNDETHLSGSLGAITEIIEEHRGKGIGYQAYLELAKKVKEDNKVLVSDSNRTEDSERVWRKLVKNNYAYKNENEYGTTIYKIDNSKLHKDMNFAPREEAFSPDFFTFTELKEDIFENCRF